MKDILPTAWFNPKEHLVGRIRNNGGWTNAHTHLDRAFTLTRRSYPLTNATLKEKWTLVDAVKRRSTPTQIYDRMCMALEAQLAQGVVAVGSFIDVDEVVRDKAITAAARVRDRYKSSVTIRFINQTLKGVIDKAARQWFDVGAQFVDIIGGLPGKDRGRERQHMDIILSTAKKLGKMAHVHVDQFNTRGECETLLLAKRTVAHGMQGRVAAIHGISIAAHPLSMRRRVYRAMKSADMMLISCPTAWIDSRRTEEYAPTHNAIAPVEELIREGIPVALGTDNIGDIYKPFTDGDLWTELRFLLESCHHYDFRSLSEVASTNGLRALGIAKRGTGLARMRNVS